MHLKSYIKKLAELPSRKIAEIEYNRQSVQFNERAIEYAFLLKCIRDLAPAKVLDVGSGTTALPALIRGCGSEVTAIDNIKDFWDHGMSNRHYHVINDDIVNTKLTGEYDMITCISTLEHIKDYDVAVENMINLLKPGGHLVLTFPYTEEIYLYNVYYIATSNAVDKDVPYICQSFSFNQIRRWGKIIKQEYWQCWAGSFWTSGEQVIPPIRVGKKDNHQLTCILLQK